MSAEQREQSLASLVDSIADSKDGNGDSVTIGEILDKFDSRSFGPLLLIPALIAVAPTGMIPGMSMITGTIIILVSLQMIAGRNHVWLPSRMESFSMPRARVGQVADAVKSWAQWIDKWLAVRWQLLSGRIGLKVIAIVCGLLATSMFPLAFLPFAVAIPGTAIMFFAIGLTTRDGVVIGIGYAMAILAAWTTYYYFVR